jgi:radical SAM protein with 4Fe4S-binding SPASM domain
MSATQAQPTRQARCERIDHFVASTRVAVFVRRADRLLLIRPDKTLGLNDSAVAILEALYARGAEPAARTLGALGPRLGVDAGRLVDDAADLCDTIGAILNGDFSPRPMLRRGAMRRELIRFPTIAEIALTYGCQNRCAFCYASSPYREGEHRSMTTAEVKLVMDKIFHQAHVPSLSFTGGEATLRPDLGELIGHGHALGFRVNLITNAIRAADDGFAGRLVDAGLDSAQVSLEAGEAALHDRIVGRRGAFARTVAGVRNLRRRGIHVHTNTTLCAPNLEHAEALIRFVGRELELRVLSLNMVIRTGVALTEPQMEVSYATVSARLPALLETARAEGVKLVWYSPIPFCLFNPVLHDLGPKSCACVDGILSVDPAGQVLPCSSFGEGIGSLLRCSFDDIYRSRRARYWRDKEFVPPVCRRCRDVDLCAGACPLYWDQAGSFAEIPRPGATDARALRRWRRQRDRSGSHGVPAPVTVARGREQPRSVSWDG